MGQQQTFCASSEKNKKGPAITTTTTDLVGVVAPNDEAALTMMNSNINNIGAVMSSPEPLVDRPLGDLTRTLSHVQTGLALLVVCTHSPVSWWKCAIADGGCCVADLVEFVFLFCFAPCPVGSSGYYALKVSRKSFPNHRRQNRGGLDNVLVELIVDAECKGKYNIYTIIVCQFCQSVNYVQ